jgi:hypothetical protein
MFVRSNSFTPEKGWIRGMGARMEGSSFVGPEKINHVLTLWRREKFHASIHTIRARGKEGTIGRTWKGEKVMSGAGRGIFRMIFFSFPI